MALIWIRMFVVEIWNQHFLAVCDLHNPILFLSLVLFGLDPFNRGQKTGALKNLSRFFSFFCRDLCLKSNDPYRVFRILFHKNLELTRNGLRFKSNCWRRDQVQIRRLGAYENENCSRGSSKRATKEEDKEKRFDSSKDLNPTFDRLLLGKISPSLEKTEIRKGEETMMACSLPKKDGFKTKWKKGSFR